MKSRKPPFRDLGGAYSDEDHTLSTPQLIGLLAIYALVPLTVIGLLYLGVRWLAHLIYKLFS